MKTRQILIMTIILLLIFACTPKVGDKRVAAGNTAANSSKTDAADNLAASDLANDTVVNDTVPAEQEGVLVEKPEETKPAEPGLDVVFKKANLPLPSWVPNNAGASPWEGSIYLADSSDGLSFSNERFFIQHAGVPNFLLDDKDQLIAVFQYFSYEDQSMFDVIAYTISTDKGKTWSYVRKIHLDMGGIMGPNAVDPTLVQLDDGRYRLYFTFQEPGYRYPALFSAVSDSLDGTFKNEGAQLSTDNMLLDPAVAYFKGEWHHYTVDHSSNRNIHSVSDSGLAFIRKDDIDTGYMMLGQALPVGDKLYFYGTGNGIVIAESDDGYTWKTLKQDVVGGADPGIARFSDGTYILTYTAMN